MPAQPTEAVDEVFEGGCFCGALRYRVTSPAADICHCHCVDCRRASGAPFVTWASFRLERFKFVKGTPGAYHYGGRIRTFCRECGTSIGFWREGLGEYDVTVASLDRPESFVPTDHTWTADQLPWVKLADKLPCHARSRK
jgi:hypothetical protein